MWPLCSSLQCAPAAAGGCLAAGERAPMPNARPAQELPHLGRNTQQSLSKVLASKIVFFAFIIKCATTKRLHIKRLYENYYILYFLTVHKEIGTEKAPKRHCFL